MLPERISKEVIETDNVQGNSDTYLITLNVENGTFEDGTVEEPSPLRRFHESPHFSDADIAMFACAAAADATGGGLSRRRSRENLIIAQ